MLVLGRNLGDFIVLNDEIFITIFETNQVGNKFKVAIEAPKDVKIARGELCEGTEEVQRKLDEIRSKKQPKAARSRS